MIATYVIKGMYISEPLAQSLSFVLKRIKEKHKEKKNVFVDVVTEYF